jgi:hypothetical protein
MEFDATPGYLFYVVDFAAAHLVSRRGSNSWCCSGSGGSVAALRRAKRKGLKLTEEWIDKDFALLDRVGMLNHTTSHQQGNGKLFFRFDRRRPWRGTITIPTATLEVRSVVAYARFNSVSGSSRRRTRSRRFRPDCSRRTHTSPAEPYRQILTFWDCPHNRTNGRATFRPALLGGTESLTHLAMKDETRQRLDTPYTIAPQGLVQSYRVRMLT